ncbi:hypothetical protein GF386_00645 [Candidatus Pacearchaeota archaeon]|nr:hypothetical protein [Candidatus Pacearchaeota archaeon]MBD3282765.1 hypothetical protein [Candidatus Pacearchaeota archaeon]
MGDFLEAVVDSCVKGYDSTKAILHVPEGDFIIPIKGQEPIVHKELAGFELPFVLALEKGDRLDFYHGCVSGTGSHYPVTIEHGHYVSVDIYRGDELIARFDSKQLQQLTEQRREREFQESFLEAA